MAVVKVRKVGTSLVITLPSQICDMFGIIEGSEYSMDVLATNLGFIIQIEGLKRLGD